MDPGKSPTVDQQIEAVFIETFKREIEKVKEGKGEKQKAQQEETAAA